MMMIHPLKTPRTEGFRMPAEWEPQEAVWLAWPQNSETFGDYLPEVQNVYLELIKGLSPGQKVQLCVRNQEEKKRVQTHLQKAKISNDNIIIHEIPTVDVWIRDYGPTFLISYHNLMLVQSSVSISSSPAST